MNCVWSLCINDLFQLDRKCIGRSLDIRELKDSFLIAKYCKNEMANAFAKIPLRPYIIFMYLVLVRKQWLEFMWIQLYIHVDNNSLLISLTYRWNFLFFLKCQQKWFSWVEYFMAPYFWFSFGNILMKMISCWHLCKKWRGTRNFRIWRLRHYYLLNLSSLKYFSSGSNFPSSGIRAWNNTLRDSSRRSFIHNKPQEHSLKKNNNSL